LVLVHSPGGAPPGQLLLSHVPLKLPPLCASCRFLPLRFAKGHQKATAPGPPTQRETAVCRSSGWWQCTMQAVDPSMTALLVAAPSPEAGRAGGAG
jgi:hypothetical protein